MNTAWALIISHSPYYIISIVGIWLMVRLRKKMRNMAAEL